MNDKPTQEPTDEKMAEAARIVFDGVAKSAKFKVGLLITLAVFSSAICYVVFSMMMVTHLNAEHISKAAVICEEQGKHAFSAQFISSDGSSGEFYVICIDEADVHKNSSGISTMLKKVPRED